MNEQHLQQILTLQQALATAAAAAVINSILNPQQAAAAGLAGQPNPNPATALGQASEASNDLVSQQQQLQQLTQLLAHHQQQQQQPQSNLSSPQPQLVPHQQPPNDINNLSNNNRIQDLLLQLQQQAALGSSPLANLSHLIAPTSTSLHSSGVLPVSPARSPISNSSGGSLNRLNAQPEFNNSATTSNIQANANLNQQPSLKKLKRHHHQQQHLSPPTHVNDHNQFHRSLEATSKPQSLSSSKISHHSSSSAGINPKSLSNSSGATNNSSSSESSAFLPNNVGLPRKLVRGQDVWLGRGAEQTRQILKCMWCGQSFRTLAEMTQHMKITQHYTNIISQEQISSWRQPDQAGPQDSPANHKQQQQAQNKQQAQSIRNIEDNLDDLSEKFHDSDREGSNFSNDDEPIEGEQNMLNNDDHLQQQQQQQQIRRHKQTSDKSTAHQQAKNRPSISLKQNLESAKSLNSETMHDDLSLAGSAIKTLSPSQQQETNLNLSTKPVTGSRKSDSSLSAETDESSQEKLSSDIVAQDGENSPSSSSSSSSRNKREKSSGSNLILADSNEESRNNKSSSSLSSSAVALGATDSLTSDTDLDNINRKFMTDTGKKASLSNSGSSQVILSKIAPGQESIVETVAKTEATDDTDEDLAIKQVLKKMLDAGGKMNGDLKDDDREQEENIRTKNSDLDSANDDKDDDDDAGVDSRDGISKVRKRKFDHDINDLPSCKVDDEDNIKADDGDDNNSNDYENDDQDRNDELASDASTSPNPIVGHSTNLDRQTTPMLATATSVSQKMPHPVGHKGDTGDPLSALETMVEKSFDPRLRPGMATGGILQRLGIDEEVCPPWQHINYANWYAAAAYGHPMAAALLAAGINLQNGIKLSKNMASQKKSDDD